MWLALYICQGARSTAWVPQMPAAQRPHVVFPIDQVSDAVQKDKEKKLLLAGEKNQSKNF